MVFAELSKDFAERKPVGEPVDEVPWFSSYWGNPNDSINDLLRRFLKNFGFEYINDLNGDVWILINNQWRNTRHEVDGRVVKFYLLEYIPN